MSKRPGGVYVYLDAHDVTHLDATIRTLKRCGAVGALVIIEGVGGHRVDVGMVRDTCERLGAEGFDAILFSFPNINGDLDASIGHMVACKLATGCEAQWDVEPCKNAAGVLVHWTQPQIDRALAADGSASITSTSAEMHDGTGRMRWSPRTREVWLQLESQTSTDTLDRRLRTYPDAVLVTGVFDEPTDPRTIDEIKRDLDRSTPQATRKRTHGIWSAHTMTPAKADAIRAWADRTFREAA